MRIPRLIHSFDLSNDLIKPQITLTKSEHHHLINVLRIKKDALIEIIDQKNAKSFICKVLDLNPNSILLEPIQEQKNITRSTTTLIAGLTKGKTADFIVEKAIEIGCNQIIFFIAERTQGRYSEAELEKKTQRFIRIRDSALKQAGPLQITPKIKISRDLSTTFSELHSTPQHNPPPEQLRLLCLPTTLEQKTNTPLLIDFIQQKSIEFSATFTKEPISELIALEHKEIPADTYLIIGPEGGLSQDEIVTALSWHYTKTSLGLRTLRSETAVIVACAMISMLRPDR